MIKQQGGIPRYQATFKLSQRRAWHQRLTPLAWFCVFLGGLGVAAVLITAMNFWVTSRNGTQLLSGQQMSQSAAQSRVVPTQSPAKYVVIVRPTARPAAVVVAAKPAKNANLVVANTSSESYDIASADASVSGDAMSGTGKKGSGGNLIAAQLAEYYKSIKEMPMGMYLAERETLLPTYFYGNGLNAVKADEAKRETYDFIKAGDVEVRVVSVKGQTAVVKIKQKSWVSDIYDVKTGEVKEADVKKDIIEQTVRVAYDPKDGRWKFAESFAPAVVDASADAAVAAPVAKPATKKVVKPVKPLATPVVQVSP
jgi:hypothetical protein